MTIKEPRITPETLKVLDAVIRGGGKASGSTIAADTRLSSGTLYPILLRLERAGWLASEWEIDQPQSLGRPRRRFYGVTAKGAAHARSAAQELQPSVGRLAWS
jgi:DNA-binding PadR family transcriptional regulator